MFFNKLWLKPLYRCLELILQSKEENSSEQDLETCLDVVNTCGKLYIWKAASLYNIPCTTIKNKIEGKHGKLIGGQTVFTSKEEEIFVSQMAMELRWN